MRLFIGLGNPGSKYINNRHNVGQMLIETLQATSSKGEIFKKTDTFMNDSGVFVKNNIVKYNLDLDNLYVAHDDLDLKLGEYKIQFGKGPKIHNGLRSIDDKLGTNAYWHIRIGVDNRNPENRIQGEEYVLDDFTSEEKDTLEKVIKEICKKLETL